jgi:TolA-binding protein
MQALRELLGGITELVTGLGPAVQLGAMPVDALKELILVICRRAKMGNAVEDAFDKIKQPPPPAQEQQPEDKSLEVEQLRQQGEQAKTQFEGQLKQMELQHQSQSEQQKAEAQAMIEKYKADRDAELEAQRLEFDRYKAALEAETKILVAQISAEAGAQQAKISAETTLQTKAMDSENSKTEKTEGKEESGQALAVAIEGFTTAIQELRKPRTVVRDNSGRIAGVQ